jgi:two-component system response regulator PilR (NtrC family)
VALSDGDVLQTDGLRSEAPESAPAVPKSALDSSSVRRPAPIEPLLPGDLQGWLDAQERAILIRALHEAGYNRTAAAQRLGLSLRQIRYRISRLAIAMPGMDPGADDDVD